jgi:murein DD-endopeptidase MepM/ murein hydrolase activator NlpD
MMFGGGWPYLTRERAIVLLLALVGLGFLLFQVNRPHQPRMSLWGGSNLWGGGTAGEQDGLTGAFQQTGQGLSGGALQPFGNPLGATNTVMTQGYGVGSHAPANVWGAIDLALDGDNDGDADPDGTWGKPIYATHSGVIKTARDTWPAGNHIWVMNDQYKTGYAHLQDFAVADGEVVQQGQIIGYIGSTGQSSGPHLDYQVWQMQGGRWVNVNPLEFGAFNLR